MSRYTFHTDPGHGWLEVPAAEVRALGVRVSPYSYTSRDGLTLYLEEDCDAAAFVVAKMRAEGVPAGGEFRAFQSRYAPRERVNERGDSFVRGLPPVGRL